MAKITGIKLGQYLSKQFGFNVINPMPCNLYGPNDSFHPVNSHVLSSLVRKFSDAIHNNDDCVNVWGLACDLAVKDKGEHIPVTQTLVQLLIAQAADFGFCAELDDEPWHWVYFAGNKVPSAVIKVEKGEKRFLTWEELAIKNAEKQAAANKK